MKKNRPIATSIAVSLALAIALGGCSNSNSNAPDDQLEERVLQIIRDNPQVVLDSLQAYQQQRREELQQARRDFVKRMRTEPASVIGDSPTMGAEEREIVLVEFSDFQCPFCARARSTVKQFMAEHGDRVTLVYKHFPLSSIHPQALPAARASWAAGQQEKFWEYHDALFERQDELGEELYEEIARELDLDIEKFESDRQSEEAKTAVEADLEFAQTIGLQGTPVFIMNGEPISMPLEIAKMEEVLARLD